MTEESRHGPRRPDARRLARNLDALRAAGSPLPTHLASAPALSVVEGAYGFPSATLEVAGHGPRRLHSAYDPIREAAQQGEALDTGQPIWLVGLGLGYLADALLARGARTLVVTEPDLGVLATALSLFDWSAALESKRLHLDAPSPSVVVLRPVQRFDHPAVADLYADHAREARFRARVNAARGSVLMVQGKLFVDDIASLLEAEGWAVRRVAPRDLDVARFDALVDAVQPQFLFTINLSPELAYLCGRRGLAYLSWTIDPLPPSRIRMIQGTDASRAIVFAHRSALVTALRAAGWPRASLLPLAASPLRQPSDADTTRYRCPVSFVGSSLATEARDLRRRLTGGPTPDDIAPRVETWLDGIFAERGCDLAFEGIGPTDLPLWWRDAMPDIDPIELSDRANGALSHRLRRHRVGALSDLGVTVYGDDGWETMGHRYRGRAHHGKELSTIYTASLANLDVPRIYQRDIITMRVFDAMRCGGAVLAEESPALRALFSDAHLLTYRDNASMRGHVVRLRCDPTLARQIGEAARRHVEGAHTMQHRLATLLEAVNAGQSSTTSTS
ncbi:MAG: glycosyltransferase [Myxococcota bacterium]